MKFLITVLSLSFSLATLSAVPTEEGLIKNVNNAEVSGNLITIKVMVQSATPTIDAVPETDASKTDFYKFVISLENSNLISLFQVAYSNGQMLNTQIKDVKYIPDLLSAIRKEKSPEKGLFYAILMMLTTNRSQGIEVFLEKNGIQIVQNKNLLNEEKMKLLRSYRTYLANNKGKGDASSPLNPSDPQSKAKVIELFKSNTFQRSKNIELVKIENEFMWQVDWRSVKAYFTNEERRLRLIDYTMGDSSVKFSALDYTMFNGINELPKFILVKDTKGQSVKMQILTLETKANREKKLIERFEEARKGLPVKASETSYSFLF